MESLRAGVLHMERGFGELATNWRMNFGAFSQICVTHLTVFAVLEV